LTAIKNIVLRCILLVTISIYSKLFWKPFRRVSYQINYEYIYPVEHNTGSFKIDLGLCMHATCFGPFSGHHKAWQYKNLTKEDVTRLGLCDCKQGAPWSLPCYIFLCKIFVLTWLMMAWETVETCSTNVETQIGFKQSCTVFDIL
jgi:hypothetical protein